MILGGRSSSMRNERIWHVALPWLFAAASFTVASVSQFHAITLAMFALGLIGLFHRVRPLFQPAIDILTRDGGRRRYRFLRNVGQFRRFYRAESCRGAQGTGGDYGDGLAAVALGFVLAAVTVLGFGRAMARAPVKAETQA